jgi:hypothetical protein
LGVNLHKEDTYSLIRLLLSLSIKVRREGLLSLCEFKTDNKILQEMINLLINGFDTDVSLRILGNLFFATKCNRIEQLHNKLIIDTYRGIQEKTQPSILRIILLSHLGPDCIATNVTDYDGILDYETSPLLKFKSNDLRRIFDSYRLFDSRKNGQLLEDHIVRLDDSSLQRIVEYVEDQILCEVLYHSRIDVIEAVLRNLPVVKANSFIEQVIYEAPYDKSSAENSILTLLNIIYLLLYEGKIQFRKDLIVLKEDDEDALFKKEFS